MAASSGGRNFVPFGWSGWCFVFLAAGLGRSGYVAACRLSASFTTANTSWKRKVFWEWLGADLVDSEDERVTISERHGLRSHYLVLWHTE